MIVPDATPAVTVTGEVVNTSLVAAAALTVRLELATPVLIAGAVVDVAEMVVVSAFGNVVARVEVDWPAVKATLVV